MFSLSSINGKGLKTCRRKYLMVDDYMLDKVLDKIKDITGTETFDGTQLLTDTDDKRPNDNTLKNVMIIMACYKR